MTYEQAIKTNPSTLAEALERAFWRQSGRGLLGAGLPETWENVAAIAFQWLVGDPHEFIPGVSSRCANCARPAKNAIHGWKAGS